MSKLTIFQKIFTGDLPSYSIYKDDNTMAFLPLKDECFSEGHILVIHKNPYRYIYEMPQKDYLELQETVLRAAKKVREVYGEKINIIQNNIADQSVFHVHFHIIPRNNEKKLLNLNLVENFSNEKMEEIVKQLKLF